MGCTLVQAVHSYGGGEAASCQSALDFVKLCVHLCTLCTHEYPLRQVYIKPGDVVAASLPVSSGPVDEVTAA